MLTFFSVSINVYELFQDRRWFVRAHNFECVCSVVSYAVWCGVLRRTELCCVF